MNARFGLGAKFNVITREKDISEDIYMRFESSRAKARLYFRAEISFK